MKSGKYLQRTGSRPYCAASFTEGTGEQHALCSVPGTCTTLHSPLPDLDCSPCGRLLIAALQPRNLSVGVSPCFAQPGGQDFLVRGAHPLSGPCHLECYFSRNCSGEGCVAGRGVGHERGFLQCMCCTLSPEKMMP